jgi:ribosomal protein L37AE/L43A
MTTGRPVLGMEILAMRKAAEEMPPYKRQDCPFCGWMLEVAADGITHCKLCGWTDEHPLRRSVPRP